MFVVVLKQQLENANKKNKNHIEVPWLGRIVANNIATLQNILKV